MSDPLLTVGLFAVLAVMVFFMFRNSRKRQRDAQEMQQKLVPGVEVMTSHGIYGTLVSLDEDKNEAIIETTPGTLLRLHRQTVVKVVDPIEEHEDEPADSSEDPAIVDDADRPADSARLDSEPEFGERSDDSGSSRAPRKKAAE